MTQVPWLDKVMRKNPIADLLQRLLRRTASLSILEFVAKAIEEKREELAHGETKSGDKMDQRKDFLTRFIELRENNPEIPTW